MDCNFRKVASAIDNDIKLTTSSEGHYMQKEEASKGVLATKEVDVCTHSR